MINKYKYHIVLGSGHCRYLTTVTFANKKDFCKTHPGVCDHFPRHHDNDVKVIHKTVVVHDRNNTPQTIIVNANPQGTCFVTQSQIVNIPGLVAQLLDQCASVTIVQG